MKYDLLKKQDKLYNHVKHHGVWLRVTLFPTKSQKHILNLKYNKRIKCSVNNDLFIKWVKLLRKTSVECDPTMTLHSLLLVPLTMLWMGLTVHGILIFLQKWKSVHFITTNWRAVISKFGTRMGTGMDWMDSTVIVTKMWVHRIIVKCLPSEF